MVGNFFIFSGAPKNCRGLKKTDKINKLNHNKKQNKPKMKLR